MKRHRTIVSILVLVPVLAAVTQASALASSLLSGYGGPGQGNQAILGSSLLNGPRNGGSAGTQGASASGVPATSIASVRANVSGHGPGKRAKRGTGNASARPPYPETKGDESALSSSAGSGTLALSSADLLYGLVAFGMLALTAVLTRRLTRVAATERHE